MKRAIVTVLFLVAGCNGGDDNPSAPSVQIPPAPPPPLCQTQNSATLIFENRSVTRQTFDVYLNNGRLGVIAVNERTPAQTVAAGVQHAAVWYRTNTGIAICSVFPIPVQCSVQLYYCDF